MGKLQPIIWAKGTLLAPQHLQAQDRFIESSMQFRLGALLFQPWGFQKLTIDNDKLTSGTFEISRASGILMDGLLFDMPDSDPLPSAIPLIDCFGQDQDSVDVYLTIPLTREGGANVSSSIQTNTRYTTQSTLMPDENSGLGERPIQLARKNFRFLVESDLREGSSALRIARVKRTPARTYELDPHFVPQVVNYASSEYLTSSLRGLIEVLSTISADLAATRRRKNEDLAAFSASDIPNFWLLYTINSYFPLLKHLYDMREAHPERLFAAMLVLAGSLTTFSRDTQPGDLPTYDHHDLYSCFSALDHSLKHLLDTGPIRKNFVALPLKFVRPSIYATSITDDKYFIKTKMYLAISAELKQADLVAKTLGLVKVGPAKHVERAVEVGVGGMPLTAIDTPPDSIPLKLNYKYFALEQVGPIWEAVKRERHLVTYVPGELPNPQLELIIVFV